MKPTTHCMCIRSLAARGLRVDVRSMIEENFHSRRSAASGCNMKRRLQCGALLGIRIRTFLQHAPQNSVAFATVAEVEQVVQRHLQFFTVGCKRQCRPRWRATPMPTYCELFLGVPNSEPHGRRCPPHEIRKPKVPC